MSIHIDIIIYTWNGQYVLQFAYRALCTVDRQYWAYTSCWLVANLQVLSTHLCNIINNNDNKATHLFLPASVKKESANTSTPTIFSSSMAKLNKYLQRSLCQRVPTASINSSLDNFPSASVSNALKMTIK